MILTALAALCLALLAGVGRLATGTWFHPVAGFAAVWAVVIALTLAASRFDYYPVDFSAVLLFLGGAVAFTAGGLAGDYLAGGRRELRRERHLRDTLDYKAIVWVCVAIHAVMLPVWWNVVNRLAGGAESLSALAYFLRVATVSGDTLPVLLGNYLVLGFIVIPVLAIGVLRGRLSILSAAIASAPWFATNLITNGRGALVGLILALSYLCVTERGRIGFRMAVAAIALFSGIFGMGAILVGKQGIENSASKGETVFKVAANLADYVLQGPILFSGYFTGRLPVESTWDALVFPCQVLKYFDACEPGSLHQEYGEIRDNGQTGNVYSVYFSIFPKYGYAGVLLILTAYGMWACYHHRRHLQGGSLAHSLLAAYLASAVILSIFNDAFAPSLNFFAKTIVTCALLRFFFGRPARRRSLRRASRGEGMESMISINQVSSGGGQR